MADCPELEDLADDGKRLDALDVTLGRQRLFYRGGSLREGSGYGIGRDT